MNTQMYKIYVNDKPVFLVDTKILEKTGLKPSKNDFVAPYTGKYKMVKQYLDLLDKNKAVTSVTIHHSDLEQLWADFKTCFKVLEAAGGYVLNPDGHLLVFYRRGSWDLPKGKIDSGETPEEAAVREVTEETGVGSLTLGKYLGQTYHTYVEKDKRILKLTWWYMMTTPEMDVTPQVEEDIEEVCWVNPAEWLQIEQNIYPNIRAIIESVDK